MNWSDFNAPMDIKGLNKMVGDMSKHTRVPTSAQQTEQLIEKTGEVHSGIEVLGEHSKNLGLLTETLINETKNVHQEVVQLTASSNRLEGLTTTLTTLTVWLIVLTGLTLVVPVGIEIWKAVREEPVVLRPPSAPPAPTLPAR